MIIKNLDLKTVSAFLFCSLIYLLFFSVTYFSGNSLESQLSISGGKRFLIPSSVLVLMFFLIAITLFILKNVVHSTKFSFVFFLFIAILLYKFVLLVFEGEDILFAFKANVFLLVTILLFLLFFYILGEDKYLSLFYVTIYRFALLSVLIGVWMLLFGGFSFLFFDLTQFGGYLRLYSWYGNPNIMATSIGLTLLVCLYSSFAASKVGMLLLFLALALTGSKGVISALLVTVLITSFIKFSYSRSKFSLNYKEVFFSLVFFIAFFYVFVQYSDFIYTSLLRLDAEDFSTASGRVEIWENAFSVMNTFDDTSLIFGVGYGSFSNDFGKSAHSYYVKTIYEDGILFILVFLSFVGLTLFKSIKKYKANGNGFYLCYFALTMFLLFRGISSPTFFQDKLESYVYIIFLIPMFFLRKRSRF